MFVVRTELQGVPGDIHRRIDLAGEGFLGRLAARQRRRRGTGARFGGTANLDAFTGTRGVTVRGEIAPCPF